MLKYAIGDLVQLTTVGTNIWNAHRDRNQNAPASTGTVIEHRYGSMTGTYPYRVRWNNYGLDIHGKAELKPACKLVVHGNTLTLEES